MLSPPGVGPRLEAAHKAAPARGAPRPSFPGREAPRWPQPRESDRRRKELEPLTALVQATPPDSYAIGRRWFPRTCGSSESRERVQRRLGGEMSSPRATLPAWRSPSWRRAEFRSFRSRKRERPSAPAANAIQPSSSRSRWEKDGQVGFPSGRLTGSNVGTWVASDRDSNVAPQILQDAWPVCGTRNFSSVRWYSAPQSHLTIVIFKICASTRPFSSE